MPKQKRNKQNSDESDSVYIVKLILYIFLGAVWLRINLNSGSGIPVPVGFLIGLMIARHERFQIDRKIEYALLLASMFISFFLPFGLVLSL